MNMLNIGQKAKVNFGNPLVMGEGEIVTITNIDELNGEIYYIGKYNGKCASTGIEIESSIQFKEGQYLLLDGTENISNESPQKALPN